MSDTTTTSTKQGSVEMDDVLRYELLESNGPKGAPTGDPVLSVRNLKVSFNTEAGRVDAVRGVNFDLWGGRTLGIVGESGSGKSVTALSLIGLLDDNAHVTGSIKLGNEELIGKTDEEMSQLRGTKISMIFQDPLSALTPMFSIGDQLAEALLTHNPHMSRSDVRKRCIELLSIVGITDPENRLDSFPHEFSGGMRQRVVIAIAIANNPDIIIADEPTTALDVTIQAQILDVLKVAQKETGAAVVLITHDLGVVAGTADDIMVMYAGRGVERASVDTLFAEPRHPYTMGLLGAVPKPHLQAEHRLVPIKG
ncbi:MAG: ABC transporter ATP-binding protein, partial [Lancefieldella parvula]|nr:ABC transporter ATP-binding protein [Lancefieldella parvula]